MSATAPTAVSPITLRQGEGESLWFLGVLATIKASSETTEGRVAVIEHFAPQGAGSPLHVHHNEDEWFYVTEGELSFWVGGGNRRESSAAGSSPRTPHPQRAPLLWTSLIAFTSLSMPQRHEARSD